MKDTEYQHTYEDIIHLEHHVSTRRKQMSNHDRAAQFAPFAALTGHEDAIKETARLTEERIHLDQHEIEQLNHVLQQIQMLEEKPEITLTYFQPDEKKAGGKYEVYRGRVKRLDAMAQQIIFTDGTRISFSAIMRINLEISP